MGKTPEIRTAILLKKWPAASPPAVIAKIPDSEDRDLLGQVDKGCSLQGLTVNLLQRACSCTVMN